MKKLILIALLALISLPASAQVKISQMPDGGNAAAGDTVPVVRGGVNFKAAFVGNTGPAGGDLSGTYPNPNVLSLFHVTTGIHDSSQSSTGVSGSLLYQNVVGGVGGLTSGSVAGGIPSGNPYPTAPGTITSKALQPITAAGLMYQASQGLIIDPRGYGASCDAVPLGDMTVTNGGTTIGSVSYNFTSADIGKSVGIQYALSGASKITAVAGHNATVDTSAFATAGGSYGVVGHDDTAGVLAALTAAQMQGGYVIAPSNCAVRNLTMPKGTSIIGGSVAQSYGYGAENALPVWYILGSGVDHDPDFGVSLAATNAAGLKGFSIFGPAFPYNTSYALGWGAGTVCVGGDGNHDASGFWTGSSNSGEGFSLEDMTVENCMVGYGRSLGHSGGYIGAISRNSSFIHNGVGIYGPFSDASFIGDDFTNNFYAGMYMLAGSNKIIGEHIEYNGDGIVFDGSGSGNNDVVGTNFDAQKWCSYRFLNGWGSVDITGGWVRGSGFQSGASSPFLGPRDAAICFHGNGSTNIGLNVSNVIFQSNGTQGNTQKYVFNADSAFGTNQTVNVHGGSVFAGYTTAMQNWAVTPPPKYEVNTTEAPLYRAADKNFSINASNALGLQTTSAVGGTILDALGASTSANSSIGFPKGSTATRPAVPVAGMVRYNTDSAGLEVYNTSWVPVGAPPVIPFYMGGLGLSNDGISPNTVIDVASGGAASDDTSATMILGSTVTKTTGAFVAGSGNGCLDTGSVASSTWYHIFLIENTTTSAADILCSTSVVSPTMPTGFGVKRRIGSILTDGSAHILPFSQVGSTFYWVTPTLDVNTAALGTSAALETLNVPPGIKVTPLCRYTMSKDGNSVILTSGDETDIAPTTANPISAAPGADTIDTTIAAGVINTGCPFLTTNTAQQVRARASAASTTLSIVTRGWID